MFSYIQVLLNQNKKSSKDYTGKSNKYLNNFLDVYYIELQEYFMSGNTQTKDPKTGVYTNTVETDCEVC